MTLPRRRTIRVLTTLAVLATCATWTSIASAATVDFDVDADTMNTELTYEPGMAVSFDVTVSNLDSDSDAGATIALELPEMTHFDAAASDSRCTGAGQAATCTSAQLANAESTSFEVIVVADAPGFDYFDATVTADPALDVDTESANDTARTGVSLYGFTDLHVNTAFEANGPISGGSIVTHVTTIANDGLASPAILYVNLPAGLVAGSLPAGCTEESTAFIICTTAQVASGGSGAVRIPLMVSSQATGSTQTVKLSAQPGIYGYDVDTDDNEASSSIAIPAYADLGLTAEAKLAAANGAGIATYSLRVVNSGPSTSPSATVTFALPAGVRFTAGDGCAKTIAGATCSFGSIASGGSATRTFTAAVDLDGSSFSRTTTFTLAGVLPDPIASNDTATATVNVSGSGTTNPTSGPNSLINGTGGGRLAGGGGNDVLFGLLGRDQLSGGPGRDRLFGGRGADRLFGGAGVDFLFGEAGDDYLDGGAGADVLSGGDGSDVVRGGAGADRMYGGPGNDTLNARDGKGGDRISCGTGLDRVLTDRGDRIDAACERIL